MIRVKKMAALAAISAAALIGSGAMSVLPASASTSTSTSTSVSASPVAPAADPTQCGPKGFVCIQNLSGDNLPATIKAWADIHNFVGHFELQFPDGVTKNSSNGTWKAGGSGFNFTGVPEANGYNMVAWAGSGSSFHQIDNVSFNVD
jgi:hypothetical protein